MLGQLKFGPGLWSPVRRETMYGIPVMRVWVDPQGKHGERRMQKAGRRLQRAGMTRVLAPWEFEQWEQLRPWGLYPVDSGHFLRHQALPITLRVLERRGVAPDRATVALRADRTDAELRHMAVQLSRKVRRLVIDVPRGGERLADWLRWEYGIPVLPPEEPAQAALCLNPAHNGKTSAEVELYGARPDLAGVQVTAPHLAREDQTHLGVLAALWEGGYLPEQGLKIT